MLLPDLAALAGDVPADAAAHFQDDGLPSDAHFAELAATPGDTMRATRRHALLLALQHAMASDLFRRQGGAAALFAALAALSPGDAFEAHLRALVDAVSSLAPAPVFLSEVFGPNSRDAGAAAPQVTNKSQAGHHNQVDMLQRAWYSASKAVAASSSCRHKPSGKLHVTDGLTFRTWQVRALRLLQAECAAHTHLYPADCAPALQLILPRLLAAACSPIRAVRAAALDALPALSGALHQGGAPAALAAPHLAALAAATSAQRAALEADGGALPAALRLSLQSAQRGGHGAGVPADSRHASWN